VVPALVAVAAGVVAVVEVAEPLPVEAEPGAVVRVAEPSSSTQ